MAIGDIMYQFILNYHFSNHRLTIIMLACVVCIAQVGYVYYALFTSPRVYMLYNIGSADVNIEAVSALSNAHQLNNCLVDYSTLECFFNDGASDDRAVKCCISNHNHHNGRRRLVIVEATATNNQCTYV